MSDVPSLRLPPREEKAASLRAKGWTKAATRRQVGVSKSTLSRWEERPEFLARVETLRTSPDIQATEILQESLTPAAKVMRDIIAGHGLEVPILCPNCREEVTVEAKADIKTQQKSAQWLLDIYYKGKLPSTKKLEPEEEDEAALDEETRGDMLRRGQGEVVEDEFDEEEEE